MSGKCEVCVRAAVLTTTVQGEETWSHARHGQLKPRPGPEQSDKKVLQRTGHRASELKWQAARREASDHRRHKIRQVYGRCTAALAAGAEGRRAGARAECLASVARTKTRAFLGSSLGARVV